ncbi:MAG: hypothetical protein D6B25_10975 [Desulfobulbaceae bacterium]|nr:MAG: hypothetical protein D6B25_10975 [Desulfobulbaceae bacterium]
MKNSFMRFVLVGLIWLVIVGGLWFYVQNRDARLGKLESTQVVDLRVDRSFSLQITSTFSSEPDPFALSTGDNSGERNLLIKLNGSMLELPPGDLSRGQTVTLTDIQGVLQGNNELFVKASPPVSESMLNHGIRLQLFEGLTGIVDQTVWGDGGALVSGSVSFSYQDQEGDQHDH